MFESVCGQAHAHGQTLSKFPIKTATAGGRNDDLNLAVFVFGSRNLPFLVLKFPERDNKVYTPSAVKNQFHDQDR